MDERDRRRLHDAIASGETALRYVRESGSHWLDDSMVVDAVVKRVEWLGECLTGTAEQAGVSSAVQAAHPEVPWRGVRGQRAVLVHDYGQLDRNLLRGILEDHLPKLLDQLRAMLAGG